MALYLTAMASSTLSDAVMMIPDDRQLRPPSRIDRKESRKDCRPDRQPPQLSDCVSSSAVDGWFCAPRCLGDNLDLFAERCSNVELAPPRCRRRQAYPSTGPNGPKRTAHANDSEQADRRWQPHGRGPPPQVYDVALKLLDEDDEASVRWVKQWRPKR